MFVNFWIIEILYIIIELFGTLGTFFADFEKGGRKSILRGGFSKFQKNVPAVPKI